MSAIHETQFHRYSPFASLPTGLYFHQLGLKWESPTSSHHDSLQFIRSNRSGTMMCAASDIITDIWSTEQRQLLHRLDTPGTQTSCMDWLSSDDFVTAGHNKEVTLWRDGQQLGQ